MSDWQVLKNDFSRVKGLARQDLDDCIGRAALRGEDFATSPPPAGGPVRTGTMVGEVTSEHNVGSLHSELNANADYSGFVNYGTSRMAANPWFDRAVEHATQGFMEDVAGMGGRLG